MCMLSYFATVRSLAGARIQKNELSLSRSRSLSLSSPKTISKSLPDLGSHATSWTDGGMESFQHLFSTNTVSPLAVHTTSAASTAATAGATTRSLDC